MINFWKLAYKEIKEQRDQLKAERENFEQMLNEECERGYQMEGKYHDMKAERDELEDKINQYKEVYRKAKAFDKVLELHSQHIDTSSIYGSDLPLSLNRYEYYDDGLFAYEMYTLIKNYLEEE